MFRIDAAHLCWVLEGLVEGVVHNRITVDPDTATWARGALQRMTQGYIERSAANEPVHCWAPL